MTEILEFLDFDIHNRLSTTESFGLNQNYDCQLSGVKKLILIFLFIPNELSNDDVFCIIGVYHKLEGSEHKSKRLVITFVFVIFTF
jgi:hypothetical protein